jgi:predicted transcriptional regulator of viral defense system
MLNLKHNALYQIAEGQGGYFATRQARQAGFSRDQLSYRTKSGQLERIVHGIYRLRRFPASPYEDLFVALLRTGPRSVISHESALGVYDLTDALPAQVHVTVPRTASRRRKGIQLHTKAIDASEITTRDGLSVTTVLRTIADVAAAGLAEEFVVQAVHQAIDRGLIRPSELRNAREKYGGRAARIIAQALREMEA